MRTVRPEAFPGIVQIASCRAAIEATSARPSPEPLGMTAEIEAIVPPEDIGALRCRDTLPGIGHLDHDAAVVHKEP